MRKLRSLMFLCVDCICVCEIVYGRSFVCVCSCAHEVTLIRAIIAVTMGTICSICFKHSRVSEQPENILFWRGNCAGINDRITSALLHWIYKSVFFARQMNGTGLITWLFRNVTRTSLLHSNILPNQAESRTIFIIDMPRLTMKMSD